MIPAPSRQVIYNPDNKQSFGLHLTHNSSQPKQVVFYTISQGVIRVHILGNWQIFTLVFVLYISAINDHHPQRFKEGRGSSLWHIPIYDTSLAPIKENRTWHMTVDNCKLYQTVIPNIFALPDVVFFFFFFFLSRVTQPLVRGMQTLKWRMYSFLSLSERRIKIRLNPCGIDNNKPWSLNLGLC